MQKLKPKDRIIVALDVPTLGEAEELLKELAPHVGLFKVGLELLTAEGAPRVVSKIHELGGRVMYDGKFADIPNTVASATRAVAALGVEMFTMHASCGRESICAAVENRGKSAVIGVTVLTSIGADECAALFAAQPDHATEYLARQFVGCGGDAIVCSPKEVALLRMNAKFAEINKARNAKGRDQVLFITPGVRPTWASTDDQKRVMTPGEAVCAGADYVVIGRPILKPPVKVGSPTNAARIIAKEIEEALAGQTASG